MKFSPALEAYRSKTAPWSSKPGDRFGRFLIPFAGGRMVIIADDGQTTGWEHVSCSFKNRIPTWTEMCYVKELFWAPDECVIQFHPPESEYVNTCTHCLHLWRKRGENWPMPPKILG